MATPNERADKPATPPSLQLERMSKLLTVSAMATNLLQVEYGDACHSYSSEVLDQFTNAAVQALLALGVSDARMLAIWNGARLVDTTSTDLWRCTEDS